MVFSEVELRQASDSTGFDLELIEKVWHLLGLLEAINADSYLESRLVLKGGTAINLFVFQLPRLSLDIDLNYIGTAGREVILLRDTDFH
jgi:predicted nucleotidyltransferase component of viral defense system